MEPSSAAAERSLAMQETSRLMINKIVCENFKSYAGVKVLGPFHKVTWAYLGKCVILWCSHEGCTARWPSAVCCPL